MTDASGSVSKWHKVAGVPTVAHIVAKTSFRHRPEVHTRGLSRKRLEDLATVTKSEKNRSAEIPTFSKKKADTPVA